MIEDHTETSSKIFRNLKNGGFITDKELKYFSFDHKRACNLGKLYFLPKINKIIFNVPGGPVISNCGTPTEKASEFLDSHLKTITAGNYMFKVNNRNTRTRCEICSKLTIKAPEQRQWRRSGVFIVNFEHISHLVLVFLLLTLSR